jgi:dynein heavy chain 2
MERNPALQTRCTLLWWDSWSEAAMKEVATARLTAVLAPTPPDALVASLVAVHAGRDNATPREFLAFVENYRRVFETRRAAVREQSGHLESGLAKLLEAARTVDELSRGAAVQQRELDQKQREAEDALNQIQAAMEKAGERKKEMEILQRRLAKEEAEMSVAKQRAEGELSEVQPLLDEARTAVSNINPRTLAELRTMAVPPVVIRDILEGVLRLLGVQDTTWDAMRRFLAERTVTQRIMQFDVRTITTDTFRKVVQLLEKNSASFSDERAEHASAAALPMCKWVKANLRYYEVADKVAPLAEQVTRLTQSLEQSQARVVKSQQVRLAAAKRGKIGWS